MQKSETAKILGLLKAAYPTYYKSQEPVDGNMLLDLWTYQFQENDFRQVFQALNAAIASKTDGFPPSIGEVKARLIDVTDPDVSPFDETWDRLLKCFKRGSVHAQEDWEKLPEDDQKLISPGEIYRIAIAEDINLTVEKAGWYSRWKTLQEKKRIEKVVPAPVREVMELAKENAKALEAKRLALSNADGSKPAEIADNTAVGSNRRTGQAVSIAELMAKKKAEIEERLKNGTDNG